MVFFLKKSRFLAILSFVPIANIGGYFYYYFYVCRYVHTSKMVELSKGILTGFLILLPVTILNSLLPNTVFTQNTFVNQIFEWADVYLAALCLTQGMAFRIRRIEKKNDR